FDSNVRGMAPGENWYEVAIELETKPVKPQGSDRHVDRVLVTLSLGFETAEEGKKGFNFYRASAEAISLEQGRSIIRFYMPPEVGKRDGILGETKFYAIDIEAEGKPQAPQRRSAGAFETAASLEGFRSRVASEAGANDGILLPQYFTPFAFNSSKPAPTFL